MPGQPAQPRAVEVCVEVTPKRAFASALEWPGWCRSGRDEDSAVAALAAYRPRYGVVPRTARVAFPAAELVVVERAPGTATTQFGAPDIAAEAERDAVTAARARRMAALVEACWGVLDTVVAGAPASLRKGPRGGGRDRDAVAEHVLAAEAAYARKLGVRLHQPSLDDPAAIAAARAAITAALEGMAREAAPPPARWPARYAARRIAWHTLDHAWEIEDRSAA